ncbi:cell envelope integrity protein CreD [Chitinolyticbacter meiyuanensis]|uniref:cell envelope integrity protein CreD n=1 Tax=Chitinolyticbacter meiyuanensis TaxID=682798 RepID=UPI0011E5E63A|nr:cell envelope integrity protein CreD [Chitinolyticbacter meiyuanensis]
MNKPLAWKLIALGFLILLLMIPLSMVRGLAGERQQRAAEVRNEMAEYAARPQTLVGPLLVLPYRRTEWAQREITENGQKRQEWYATSSEEAVTVLQPDQLTVNATLATEALQRGIYEARLYHADSGVAGGFTIPAKKTLEVAAAEGKRYDYQWGKPMLVLGVSDARGIGALSGSLNELPLSFKPGAVMPWLPAGLHAALDVALAEDEQKLPFRLQLKLSGTGELAIAPVGKSSNVTLSGNWPHPSFAGRFAPQRRNIDAKGFAVEWQTSDWASGFNEQALAQCVAQGAQCALFQGEQLGLKLVDPVDRYLLTERTVKYGELFLLLIFGAVLTVEVLRRVAVHPVQYGLVGLALALFFLLTLALSEHIAFWAAYWIAAAASTLLLGYYGCHVLGGWRAGSGFAGLLAGLYGLLFGILQSEDMALLMGSIALFALLAVVMVLTRHVDWYALTRSAAPPVAQPLAEEN